MNAMLEALRQRVPPRTMVLVVIAILFALIAVIAGCSWLTRAQAPRDQADLLRMIAEARDSLDGPGRSVDVAAKALDTPEAALAFVRDEIVLADYRYRRLDPDAALAFRSANGVDKAALLAALIKAQGYEAQIYHADWPRDVMPIRATGLKVPPAMQTLIRAMGPNRDAESRTEIERRGAALRGSVERASTLVEPMVHGASNDSGASLPRYRYWVRARKDGGEWRNFDPLFADQPTDQGYSVVLDDVVPVRIELLSEDQAGVRRSLITWRGPITGDMSLSYLPTAGAQAYLNGDASPDTVALWTPILAVDGRAIAGRPFAADGSVAPAGRDGGPLFPTTDAAPVPSIRSLGIERIDASNFPRVEALVRADVAGETAWRAHFLQLSDNGKPAQVRIVEQPASVYGGRTIVFVIDNSGSMASHLDRMRQIMFDLIDRLGPGIRVGMTHTEAPDRMVVPPRFLTDKPALKAEIEAALKPGGANRELTAIRTVLRDVSGPVDIILAGDGELDNASTTGLIRSIVEERDSQIYSILVTGSPDLYRAFSAEVWSALPGQLPATLTDRLSDRFSDRLRIAWTASGPSREGRQVTLASPGWQGGPARAAYQVEAAPDGVATESPLGPGLILSVSTEVPGEAPHLRRIVPLEGPHAARALTSVARISLVPGLAPDNAVMAANLDVWHGIGTANLDGGRTVPPFRSGPSFMAMARSNALLRGAMTAYGDALYLERPLILVERIAIETGANGQTKLKRTLDVMNPEVLTQRLDEPRPWRIGLAIAAGEGAALGVEGLSPAILGASRPTVVELEDPLPPGLAGIAEARSIHALTRDGRRTLVTAANAGPNAWVIGRGGYLEVRTFDPAGKGANAEQAIADFKRQKANLRRAGVLWSGLATPYGVPGAPLGGVVGILEADRKLWCYSSVMMGYVADDIAGTNAADESDPLVWKARAGAACELDPERFGRELGIGIATGAISNQITDNILTAGNYGYRAWQTGPGTPFDLTDSISAEMSVLIAAGLSGAFEYGHVNDRIGGLVGDALP